MLKYLYVYFLIGGLICIGSMFLNLVNSGNQFAFGVAYLLIAGFLFSKRDKIKSRFSGNLLVPFLFIAWNILGMIGISLLIKHKLAADIFFVLSGVSLVLFLVLFLIKFLKPASDIYS